MISPIVFTWDAAKIPAATARICVGERKDCRFFSFTRHSDGVARAASAKFGSFGREID
jgi:hypothetical protein